MSQPDENQQTYYDELVQITINSATQPEEVRTITNYGRELQSQMTPSKSKGNAQYSSTVSTTQNADPIYLAQITDSKRANNMSSNVRDTVNSTNLHLATNDMNDPIQETERRHNNWITREITTESYHGTNSSEDVSGTTMGKQQVRKRVTIAETNINNSTGNSGGQNKYMLSEYMKNEIRHPKNARKWLQAVEVPPKAQWCPAGESCKNHSIHAPLLLEWVPERISRELS